MNKLIMMITILKRSVSEDAISFLNSEGISLTLGRYGTGTAPSVTSEIFVPDKEKCVLFSFVPFAKSKRLMQNLISKFSHAGIAFSVPITSVGGKSVLEYLVGNNEVEEVNEMEVKIENELIVAVANRGYTEFVMNVAKEAGASGGTVIHARGTGEEASEKFFGATLGAEKEMIFIVTSKENKNNIMDAIMKKAGINSEAKAFVFSLPVIDVAK